MKVILLIHGPNLNTLGHRNPEHYGSLTLQDLEDLCRRKAQEAGHELLAFQSNHEGALIDFIQEHAPNAAGILINPGALTHYSYALHDALLDSALPAVEVHLSAIENREKWRQISVTAKACIGQVSGKKEQGYEEALGILLDAFGVHN